jgi:two-component system, chemotaxis family, chemotaxis protein CheY
MAKILIVDDSALSRRRLRGILESAEHTVIEAEEGMIAIEKYFLERPDVVLLDLIMRGMFGIEVLKKLRQMDPQVKVVVATADIQTSTQTIVLEEGAMSFVTKPFVPEQILMAVNSALEVSDAAD